MGKLQFFEPPQTSSQQHHHRRQQKRFSTTVVVVERSNFKSAVTAAMRLPTSSATAASFSFRILSCTFFFFFLVILLLIGGKHQADSFQFSSTTSSKKKSTCSSLHRSSSLVMEQDTATKVMLPQQEEEEEEEEDLLPSSLSSLKQQNNNNINNNRSKLQPFQKQKKHRLDGRKNRSWEEKYIKLTEFKAKYGHVDVPQQATKQFQNDGQIDKELAIFCRNVRSQYKLLQNPQTKSLSFLTQDRIDKLEAIGFQWNSHDATWELRYKELVNFYKQYNHSNVPTTKFEQNNPELSKWVSYQRLRYKGIAGKPLSTRQLDLLNKIDFRWYPKDEVWWDNYKQLKSFKELHGHFRVAEPKLKQWKYNLRRLCREYVVAVSISSEEKGGSTDNVHVSGLNQERIKALIDIQFCWLPDSSISNNSVYYGGNGGDESTTTTTTQPPENIFEGYQ